MKKAILLVAYGAGTRQARQGLAHFETLCRARYPNWPIRWAFTSHILRQRIVLQKRKSDSVAKAVMRLALENFQAVAIQPLQTIAGREHGEMRSQAQAAACAAGIACAIGAPLLWHEDNLPDVARALIAHLPSERTITENVIFMGHGARHAAGRMYQQLDAVMRQLDARVRVGAMNGPVHLEDLLAGLAPGPVWLLPLLSTVGSHALRDMAGPGPDSWRARIEKSGRICHPVLRGMAESASICQIWLERLASAMAEIA